MLIFPKQLPKHSTVLTILWILTSNSYSLQCKLNVFIVLFLYYFFQYPIILYYETKQFFLTKLYFVEKNLVVCLELTWNPTFPCFNNGSGKTGNILYGLDMALCSRSAQQPGAHIHSDTLSLYGNNCCTCRWCW